tara:strand:- start:72 stop:530 length:459 start_codon:yes stop_codon:yes gene_type:complete
MESIKRWKETILGSRRDHCSSSRSRLGYWLVVIAGCACTVGCTTLKKAGIVSLAAGAGATVGTVLSGGATAPILGATATAFVADAVTEAIPIGNQGRKLMNECAPDNFWSLLGSLVEMGGWLLILIFVAPMVLGWILPGPLERKKKQKNLFL